MIRPEEANIVGGEDPKTDWILRINSIMNKLCKDSYSVPVDEYSYIKSIHEWLMGILLLKITIFMSLNSEKGLGESNE